MPKVYDFDTMNRVAKAGSTFIEKYLKSKPNVVDVVNVEEDPAYQKKDIDLVVHMQKGEAIETYTVEIKVDQYFDKTKNYFLRPSVMMCTIRLGASLRAKPTSYSITSLGRKYISLL